MATAALKYQAPAMPRVQNVYWTIPQRVVVQLVTTLALMVSHASPTPSGNAGRSGAPLREALPVPFLVSPSLALFILPSITIYHLPSLPHFPNPGLGEGEPNGGSSLKSWHPSTVWEGGSTFLGKGHGNWDHTLFWCW